MVKGLKAPFVHLIRHIFLAVYMPVSFFLFTVWEHWYNKKIDTILFFKLGNLWGSKCADPVRPVRNPRRYCLHCYTNTHLQRACTSQCLRRIVHLYLQFRMQSWMILKNTYFVVPTRDMNEQFVAWFLSFIHCCGVWIEIVAFIFGTSAKCGHVLIVMYVFLGVTFLTIWTKNTSGKLVPGTRTKPNILQWT